MKNIILEGIDKTGKTTLANLLQKVYGYQIIKCSQPDGDPYIEYLKKLQQVAKSKKPIVFDRFHLGELAYGPVYRKKSRLTIKQLQNIELQAMSLNFEIIYCHDDVKELATRFKTDDEKFANIKDIKKLNDLFNQALSKSILPIHYHQMKTKSDLTKNNALKKIIGAEELKAIADRQVIGNVMSPKLLLVGDAGNFKGKYIDVAQPFDFGPSSRFLFWALEKANVSLCDVAIINSDHDKLKNIVGLISPKIVVALGQKSADKLTAKKIYFKLIPHPQYFNRFHQANKNQYVKWLSQFYNQG